MIESKGIAYQYAAGQLLAFPDIKVERGGQLLIVGQSGSGKTTLLHLLAGLRKPLKGEIQVNGTYMHTLSAGQLDAFRGNHIGVVFQKPHFLKSLTVAQNLQLVASLHGNKAASAFNQSLLQKLNLQHKTNAYQHQLSEGEKQRVSLAIALGAKPSVLLADEPTSALDDHNCEQVVKLLKEVAAELSSSLVVVTHDQRLKAAFGHFIELSPAQSGFQ